MHKENPTMNSPSKQKTALNTLLGLFIMSMESSSISTYRLTKRLWNVLISKRGRQTGSVYYVGLLWCPIIQRFRPVAHFDLYKPNLRFADFPVVQKMIERSIRFAVDYGVLFEINTVAFRKEWPSSYLAKDFVEVCVLLLTQGSAYVKSLFFLR